jgi:hypothetical protein
VLRIFLCSSRLSDRALIPRNFHVDLPIQCAEHSILGRLLFASHVKDRAADQLRHQPLIIGFGVQAAFVVSIQLLSCRRIAVAGRTTKTLGTNFNDHWPPKDRQLAQAQQAPITRELADFGAALGADRPLSCALDRNDGLSLAQLGFEDADFGQIQGDFNLRRHRFYHPLCFMKAEARHSPTVVKRPQNVGGPTRVPKEPICFHAPSL